jgi:hypothetical protein
MNEPVRDKLNLQKLFLLGQYYRQAECNTGHSGYARQIIRLLNEYGIFTTDSRLATRIAAWIICQNGLLPDADTQRRISLEVQNEILSHYN